MTQKRWKCGELCILGFKNPNLAQFLNIFAQPHGRTVAAFRNSGLTHLFGGTLGCVDKNGENIPASSCSAGVEEDTEYLKCGDNCFVACQGRGSVFQIATETFKGRGKSLIGTGCRDLCQLAEGCISFKYKQSMDKEECTLKYNQEQADTSDTCKGNN